MSARARPRASKGASGPAQRVPKGAERLARDIVLVRTFGDTVVGSAFSSAFQIPNMFRRLFGEGALSAAFVPEYTDAVRAGDHDPAGPSAPSASHPTEADRFASLVILALGVVTGAITVLVEVVLFGLLLLTAPNPEQRLSILLIAIIITRSVQRPKNKYVGTYRQVGVTS